jgi:hypothetical protein
VGVGCDGFIESLQDGYRYVLSVEWGTDGRVLKEQISFDVDDDKKVTVAFRVWAHSLAAPIHAVDE